MSAAFPLRPRAGGFFRAPQKEQTLASLHESVFKLKQRDGEHTLRHGR